MVYVMGLTEAPTTVIFDKKVVPGCIARRVERRLRGDSGAT